jgi:hypothetical protein
LGAPDTVILFGGPIDYEERSGGRFTLGYWFDRCQNYGIEGSGFFLAERSVHFTASGTGAAGTPFLSRPFVNAVTGNEAIQIVAAPGMSSGSVTVTSSSELWGAELNGIINLGRCGLCNWGLLGPGRLDLLVGGRYAQLKENLEILENPTLISGPGAGTSFIVDDRFHTRNQFGGGQLGLRREWCWQRWSLDVTGKVALGETHQEVDINGSTIITPPGGPSRAFTGGLLALPTNIGSFSRDRFSVMPELGVNVGYQFTPHIRGFVGYSLLYWTNVARPGDQIDLTVNTSQVPRFNGGTGTLVGPARPAFTFHDTDFWAQGVNVGLEIKY